MVLPPNLDELQTGVKLERLSPLSASGDVEAEGISFLFNGRFRHELTNAERYAKIERSIWRCKIGKTAKWHYASTAEAAAQLALSAVEHA